MEKIAEGKTKEIWLTDFPDKVLIKSKDDITAGDGAKHDVIPGKAEYATTTTCNCFSLLNRAGLRTHYLERSLLDKQGFFARHMEMIPIELVARRIATGSYLKREPAVKEGTIFNELVIEFFFKDDAQHDPLMIIDPAGRRVLYYDAKQPLATESDLANLKNNYQWVAEATDLFLRS